MKKTKDKKVMVAVPCMDMMHSLTAKSLCGLRVPEGTRYQFAIGSLVYDARNQITEEAIKDGCGRILWIDSDMIFDADLLERLSADMDSTGADMVCALCVTREPPIVPVILEQLEAEEADGAVRIRHRQYLDYPPDSLFPVAGCGFGAVLVSVGICQKLMKTGLPFSPLPGLGEDLSFCLKARERGAKIYCDSAIKVGHIGRIVYDESDFRFLRQMAGRGREAGA